MPASIVTEIGSPAESTKYGWSWTAEIAPRTAAADAAALNPSGLRAPTPTIETEYRESKLAAAVIDPPPPALRGSHSSRTRSSGRDSRRLYWRQAVWYAIPS